MVDTGSWVSENSSSETVRKVSDASAMYPFGSPKGYYFSPFWPPYTDQIHGRSVARTPFRTVSEEKFSETQSSDHVSGSARAHPSEHDRRGQILVDVPHGYGTLPHCRGDSFDRALTRVTDRENARHARLER